MATRYETHVRASRQRKLYIVRKYKEQTGCQMCGEKRGECLDFHHRDSALKHQHLKSGKKGRGQEWISMSYGALLEEIRKCDVLCANCHRTVDRKIIYASDQLAGRLLLTERVSQKLIDLADALDVELPWEPVENPDNDSNVVRPCQNGHDVSERDSSGKCLACERERARRYFATNEDAVEKRKERQARHRAQPDYKEKQAKRMKEWRQRKREESR